MTNSFPTIPTTDTESKEYKRIKTAHTKDALLSEIHNLQRQASTLSAQLSDTRTQRDRFRELAAQRTNDITTLKNEVQLSDWSDVIKRFRQLTSSAIKQQSRQAAAELRTISWG